VELVPRNPAAATVAIEHSPDADDEDEEVWVTVADEAAPEEPGDLKRLEMALRAVIAGRVKVVEGSGQRAATRSRGTTAPSEPCPDVG